MTQSRVSPGLPGDKCCGRSAEVSAAKTMADESLKFVKLLGRLYYEQRDMNAVLSCMTDETSWIGTGAHELCMNLRDAREFLDQELAEYSGRFQIIGESCRALPISDTASVVFGRINARADDADIENLYNRLTAVCVKSENGIKLVHLHLSRPDSDQEQGRFYVKRGSLSEKHALRIRADETAKQLLNRNRELEALTENIPGGVHQCLDDSNFTIISMSNSFLSLFGYTREEIQELFHGRFAEMIVPDDRESVQNAMKRQLAHGNTVESEYRVRRRDGALLWILDKGRLFIQPDGTRTFYCVLLDITAQKKEQEALRLSLERHQIIMDQATDIIFEWDIARDALVFSANWRKKFGYDAISESISRWIPYSANIHPDDMPAFLKIMRDTAAGVPYSETEFRIRDVMGCYTWCRIRATTQYDGGGHPIKAVGVIVDIDTDKKQRQKLLDQAERDSLTGLLDREAARRAIGKYTLGGNNNHGVLLIIDLDDFKQINDCYGHLCGDAVLTDAARTFRRIFRASDVTARIGGDEFMVYMPGLSQENAEKKMKELMEALESIQVYGQKKKVYCSVGAAFYPTDAGDFQALYRCADLALYHVKNSGKHSMAFYDSRMNQQEPGGKLLHSAVNALIDSDQSPVTELLGQYCFRMLYHAIDPDTAVRQILEIVGSSYDVSRVYIFESSEDGTSCSNTYEWCSTGVCSQLKQLQNLSYGNDLGGYLENFNEEGFFYCDDIHQLKPCLSKILERQNVRSLLQCAIMDDGQFKGFVGFDEYRENRFWTREQIDALTLVAKVLSTFLLKLRLKEQLARLKGSCPGAGSDSGEGQGID